MGLEPVHNGKAFPYMATGRPPGASHVQQLGIELLNHYTVFL